MSRISLRQIVTYAAAAGVLLLARPYWPTYIAGCGLALIGIFVRVWGCGHLRKNKELITSGPYAHVQHPLYLGTFLIALGGIVAAGSPQMPGLLIWALLGPVFLIAFFGYYLPKKKRVEGARLAERFPDQYPAFAQAVPAFVPALRGYPQPNAPSWSGSVFLNNHEWQMDLLIVAIFALIAFVPRIVSWW
jgi:protein-S-isoprenylcysteine O-methyltransferase Ste14